MAKTRCLQIATMGSGVLAFACVLLFPISEFLTVVEMQENGFGPHHAIKLTTTFHCGISRGGVWFFNQGGPYTGSLRFIDGGEDGLISSSGGLVRVTRDWSWILGESGVVQESYWDYKTGVLVGRDRSADFPGIYLRHFDWKINGPPWTTLRISLWYPLLLFSILPGWWAIRRRCKKKPTDAPSDSPVRATPA